MGGRVTGIDLQRTPVGFCRFLYFALCTQHVAKIIMGFRGCAIEGERPRNKFVRFVKLVLPVGEDAKVMQRREILWMFFQHCPIRGFGFLMFTLLVRSNSLG